VSVHRESVFYEDAKGHSDVRETLRSINKDDPRHTRHIRNKIRLLEQVEDIDTDATRSRLVKRPTAHIYVLIVSGHGGFAFRLPFFVPECKGGKQIVFTGCEKRRGLDGNYGSLIEIAEFRRSDWIHRNC